MAFDGALKTLFTTLQASPFLAGVALGFGEELIGTTDLPTPCVIVAPVGGPWDAPGYVAGIDPQTENVWKTDEAVDLHMWAHSPSPTAQAIDHANEAELLRQKMLSALQDQRNQATSSGANATGLYWKPVNGRWLPMGNSVNRYGRAYVLTVIAEISVPMDPPTAGEATITAVNTNNSITSSQYVG